MRTPSAENGSSVMMSASWYKVTIETAEAAGTCRSRASVGSATPTIDPSSTASAVPKETATMAR